jgi:serine/threonine-protein kinase
MLGQVVLGKYKVYRLLDEGGMSKIYLARQANRDVVVKVLKDSMRAHPKACEHFRREIHILSRFHHPNAVAYCDSAPNERQGPVLVMEYLCGVPLNLLLEREGRLAPERAGRLLGQLCDVLEAAHAAGVVHRDIKPGNLMLLHPGTPQELLKLMDFGLAKMSSLLYISPDELFDWSLPAAAGTPEYISPEQVRGTDMDGRGDLYSAGVVLFEMLTGRRPFEHASVQGLMQAHAEQPPPSFADRGVTGVPPAVEAVVRRCLAKYPEQRPASARELALAYEKALGRRITSGFRPALPSPAPGTGAPARATSGPSTPIPGSGEHRSLAADRNAVRQSVEACMPESMAMLKLKGFIQDLGGEVVESVPGLIRVRLEEPAAKKPSGLRALFDRDNSRRTTVLKPPTATDLELHMERRDPSQSSRLTITLVLRAGNGMVTPEWRSRCAQIGRDFQAYLMGR